MIAQASQNAFLAKVLADVSGLLHDARRRTDQVEGATAKARHQHVAICEAIAARDEDRAMAAMQEHIESAKWALEQVLEHSTSEDAE
jgi:DNA-binding FadR family transcriptional regulator